MGAYDWTEIDSYTNADGEEIKVGAKVWMDSAYLGYRVSVEIVSTGRHNDSGVVWSTFDPLDRFGRVRAPRDRDVCMSPERMHLTNERGETVAERVADVYRADAAVAS